MRQRLAGIRQLGREVNCILELISTGLASPYVPNTIIRQMLRPFRRNDIRTTLRTLIDRRFTHGRFLHFGFFEFTRVAWQCYDRLIMASRDAGRMRGHLLRGLRRDAPPLDCGVSSLGNMCDGWQGEFTVQLITPYLPDATKYNADSQCSQDPKDR